MRSYRTIFFLVFFGVKGFASPPPELPGEDITNSVSAEEAHIDSIQATIPRDIPTSVGWLDAAQLSWDAPGIALQVASDASFTPLGKGSIFIPRLTNSTLEPDVDILDATGNSIATGKSGKKINVMAGNYFAVFGSGSHEQRMIRQVVVTEGEITTVAPDFSGLAIEVVDENNIAVKGEYELARIDEFESFGRAYGADPDLGEEPKTWILKPGLYKIFGVGQSYNTQTNYITVRLMSGELTHVQLVLNNISEMKIMGGGVLTNRATRTLLSDWKYGLDLGGSFFFNATTDFRKAKTDTTTVSSLVAALFGGRLNYRKEPVEWNTSLKFDEGVTIQSFDIGSLAINSDKARLVSLFTWRFLPWLGPYGRLEALTNIFPIFKNGTTSAEKQYFALTSSDSLLTSIDSVSRTRLLQPSFSPFGLETGLGVNVNLISRRFVESRLLAGLGFKSDFTRGISVLSDTVKPDLSSEKALFDSLISQKKEVTILRRTAQNGRPEFGPEAALKVTLRLGPVGTLESECKILLPFERISHPDVNWTNTLSIRIFRAVTFDYDYTYTLKQPSAADAQMNQAQHRVWVRFSYSSM